MSGLELTGLAGKVAVVTGAGRMLSIGRPIAVELARGLRCGHHRHRSPGRAVSRLRAGGGWRDIDSVADEVRGLGRRALPVVSNAADPDAVDELVERVLQELGRVDIVVNNESAAVGADRVPVIDMPLDEWRRVIDVNLNGTFYMSRAFGRRIVDQGEGGSIVNISSIAAKVVTAKQAAYTASKSGIHALTAAMAQRARTEPRPGEHDLPRLHRHRSHTRHPTGRPMGQGHRREGAARTGRRGRGHRLDGRVPVLRPGHVDHRPDLLDRRR